MYFPVEEHTTTYDEYWWKKKIKPESDQAFGSNY